MDFASVLGGLGSAYAGYNKGADAQLERNQKAARDEAERRRLDDEAALAPLQQQAKRAQLESQVDQANAEAELAPTRRKLEKSSLDAQADLLPGQIEMAKRQQQIDIQKQVHSIGVQVADGLVTEAQAQDKIFALIGRKMQLGDYEGVAHTMNEAQNIPTFAGTKQYGSVVNIKPVKVGNGAVDMAGNPISGSALQATFSSGKTGLIQPGGFSAAYSQQLAAQYKPLITKPGETARDPITGAVKWKNDPLPNRWFDVDENGNTIYMGNGGVGGGAGGAGSRGGGKVVDPAKAASDAWELVATKSDAKLAPDVNARGASLTHQLATENSGMPVQKAAEIALTIAQDPTKVQPAINLMTGRIDGVYSDKRNGDVVIDRGIATVNNPGDVTPEQMKTAVSKFIAARPQEERDEMVAAAFDQGARNQLQAKLFAKIDADAEAQIKANPKQEAAIKQFAEATKKSTMQTLSEKLALINRYGTNPKAKKESTGSGWSFGGGGLPTRESPKTDPNSPAGRSQARQQQAREANQAKEQARAEARAQLAAQFQRDKTSMEPLDLARKYNELRGDLPTKEAAELQQIERNIR